nr:hypothetical protein CFP56_41838 [Quercus suber]
MHTVPVFSDINSFLNKVLDEPTDWTARPYSTLKHGVPPLFTSLDSVPVSRYRDTPWAEEELSFVACAFPFHLQARFQEEYETQAYNPHRFSRQFGFDQGVLGHFSTLVLPAIVASLGFKRKTSSRYWKHVRNFEESGAQQVDVPFVFHNDLTLKLPTKAKLSSTRRKKSAKVSSIKKPKVTKSVPQAQIKTKVIPSTQKAYVQEMTSDEET